LQLLIASDIASRGLDIKDVTHIFNLDLPENLKEYLHRAGRTGRTGNTGAAISIVNEKEAAILKRIEKAYDIKIKAKRLYGGRLLDR
ncbi:MAG TPA: ATP-dependent helicase, partial [Clostridiaceae bacterium]|nr:ATP-dependent helicase [Clostridiaceae bacterium]